MGTTHRPSPIPRLVMAALTERIYHVLVTVLKNLKKLTSDEAYCIVIFETIYLIERGRVSNMTLSNKLRIYRAEAKLSQQEVADAIHISKSKYCRMENGTAMPNADELNALLSLFNISYEEMVNTAFPITHTIKYPSKLLSMLENSIKENSEISENWNENRLRYNRLKEALEPLMNIRSEAMDFPELDLTYIIPGTTVKTVNLDMRGEYLIDQCLKAQERLANALFG